jgi:hypothetical protein
MIGFEAVKSDLPYDEAMTKILLSNLDSLGSVKTEEDTYAAFEAVRDIWWTRDKRLPNKKILLERDTETYLHCRPWLIAGRIEGNAIPKVLDVPVTSRNGQPLTNFYKLSIDLNHKFPVKEIFPERKTRLITQGDFQALIDRVTQEMKSLDHSSFTNTETHQRETDKNRL